MMLLANTSYIFLTNWESLAVWCCLNMCSGITIAMPFYSKRQHRAEGRYWLHVTVKTGLNQGAVEAQWLLGAHRLERE